MINVQEILDDLNGNGFEQGELLDLSAKLTKMSTLRMEIIGLLGGFYDADELLHIAGSLEVPSIEKVIMSKAFEDLLSRREKQCFLMHTVGIKSWGNIAKEIGISKSSVQTHITRARKKIAEIA